MSGNKGTCHSVTDSSKHDAAGLTANTGYLVLCSRRKNNFFWDSSGRQFCVEVAAFVNLQARIGTVFQRGKGCLDCDFDVF